MPVVELSYSRLQKLVGAKATKKKISESLPYLGLDIEGEDGDTVRVEYSPNRPDYSTDIGISLGLQGLLGIKTGLVPLRVKKSKNFSLKVDSSVRKIRPFVTGIIARDGKIDDSLLKQLIVMQEDLHSGIGRGRIKSSIGIHDLYKVDFPLRYTTIDHRHKFIPLNSKEESTISEILHDTDIGKKYGFILGTGSSFPVILDKNNETVSFPPIINAAKTTVNKDTQNIFVEITGLNKTDVENVLSIIAVIFQAAGFKLESLNISGSRNSTPRLTKRKNLFEPELVNKTIGTSLSPSKIVSSLKRSRLGAKIKGKRIECTIPSYRFDIFGPMDLVEEAVLGFGIENIKPRVSPSEVLGQKNEISSRLKTLSQSMVGLGCTEALHSSLTGHNVLYGATKRDPKNEIAVMDSKSQEHTILRDMIIPQLLDSLSKNIHEPYPQRLFEIGTVFSPNTPIDETTSLACVIANKDANFSEAKAVAQSALRSSFGITVKTMTSNQPMFEKGKNATIEVDGKTFGVIGEISNKVLENFRIRATVAAFEISLSGLIFD
ncbi:MAG: phenylalanine--tRNA ligase subunit beta [Nitrosopumilaceae archaeon]|nr:phenylalanine--tRNA ligase subunit beta [Nitrosopumilaceae archaeon]NIU02320.1 phenylalanine--tRNA ligase subunit beta [Nitrosopumilaceae archaeon]NIU88775.1 phenylalanine--tRNA ligase subunit beta [Nitrosopumilaceae archaeon]NIV66902.1 phenylalanine--tRNA ligase subunit beta [Nitrosopumilaceae archaeon]NIX62921.1 phenylalanine--tRNA ligase subunit beta [Nitrosopumilaceae archaeon]